MRGALETELLVDWGVSPYPSGRRIIIRWPDGAAPRWDKCEWDWSYLPEIAERASREGAVTQGSTTAQSLFNYERTGYTGPNRSRRDLPSMLLCVDGRGTAKDILRSGCTTTPAMGAVRRRMRTQTATPASFHFRLVRLIQVKLSK